MKSTEGLERPLQVHPQGADTAIPIFNRGQASPRSVTKLG